MVEDKTQETTDPFAGLQPLYSVRFDLKGITVSSSAGSTLYTGKRNNLMRRIAFYRAGADTPSFVLRPKGFLSTQYVILETFDAVIGRIKMRRKGSTYDYILVDSVDYEVGVLSDVHRKRPKELWDELKRATGTKGWFAPLKALMALGKTNPQLAKELDLRYGDYMELSAETGVLLRFLKQSFIKEITVYAPDYARRIDERLAVSLAAVVLTSPNQSRTD